jgi:hypothetical protein
VACLVPESFKSTRLKTPIRYKTKTKPRSVASVNREFFLLSKIFSRAVIDKEVAQNPFRAKKIASATWRSKKRSG